MLLRCTNCRETFKLAGDHKPLVRDLGKGLVKCPLCLQVAVVLTTVRAVDGLQLYELTAEQFWGAANGFGMPDEIVTEPETVEAMLLAHRVRKVHLDRTQSGHVVVRKLELDNRITLHFTVSGEGAVIFKATRTKEEKDAS